jgi:hypothetical protein
LVLDLSLAYFSELPGIGVVMEKTQPLKTRYGAFHGGCLCGKVRFSTSALRDLVYCHCSQCRRSHGNFAAYSATDSTLCKFSVTEGLRWYQSSPVVRRGFCERCGSSLFWQSRDSRTLCIAAGAIDDGSVLQASRHIYVADKSSYYTIDDGLAQFESSMNE